MMGNKLCKAGANQAVQQEAVDTMPTNTANAANAAPPVTPPVITSEQRKNDQQAKIHAGKAQFEQMLNNRHKDDATASTSTSSALDTTGSTTAGMPQKKAVRSAAADTILESPACTESALSPASGSTPKENPPVDSPEDKLKAALQLEAAVKNAIDTVAHDTDQVQEALSKHVGHFDRMSEDMKESVKSMKRANEAAASMQQSAAEMRTDAADMSANAAEMSADATEMAKTASAMVGSADRIVNMLQILAERKKAGTLDLKNIEYRPPGGNNGEGSS